MNYYVPLPQDEAPSKQRNSSNHRYMPYVSPSYTPSIPQDKTISCMKQCDVAKPRYTPRYTSRYTPRIMSRRFALTASAYKYLDIGINVRHEHSDVEMVLGDNRGHEMEIPYSTWETLIKKRADIERLLQFKEDSSLRIDGGLVVELIKMYNDSIIIKLTLGVDCMYMKPTTLVFLFELEHCVGHEYFRLYGSLEDVNDSFEQLVRGLQRNLCGSDSDQVLETLRTVYDKTSAIDCELVLYAVDELVAETLKRGDVQ